MTFLTDLLYAFALITCSTSTRAFQADDSIGVRDSADGHLAAPFAPRRLAKEEMSRATCANYHDVDDIALLQTLNLLQTDLRRQDAASQDFLRAIAAESPVFLDAYEIYNKRVLSHDMSKRSRAQAMSNMSDGRASFQSKSHRSIPFPHGKFSWERGTPQNSSNGTSLAEQVANWTTAQLAQVNESSPEVQQRVKAFTSYVTTSTAPPAPAAKSNASMFQKEAPKVISTASTSAHAKEAATSSVVSSSAIPSALVQHRRELSTTNRSQTIGKLKERHVGKKIGAKKSASNGTSPLKLVLRKKQQRSAQTDLDSLIDEIMGPDH